MATGPAHYREAEQLVQRAHHFTYGDGADPAVGLALATESLAHATLALAAATAMAAPVDQEADSGMPPDDARAWHAACGTKS